MLAPGLAPSFGAPPSGASPLGEPAGAISWLAAGTAQSLSQFALLAVIIGVSGRLREYGAVRPRPSDAPAGALILGLVILAARLGAWLVGLASAVGLVTAPSAGALDFLPTAGGAGSAALLLASASFAAAVAYREELFYRLYVIGALRERGVGNGVAAALSVALFAAGHAYQGVQGVVSSILVGTVMAAAAVRGARLHALAGAHAIYDLGVLITAFGAAAG
jgi:membrane protease YdiL (CAAX protease family)